MNGGKGKELPSNLRSTSSERLVHDDDDNNNN